jgi:hypothetical protein
MLERRPPAGLKPIGSPAAQGCHIGSSASPVNRRSYEEAIARSLTGLEESSRETTVIQVFYMIESTDV